MNERPALGLTSLLGLFFWLFLCFAAAWFGSLFPPGAWYAQLVKPAFNPPAWVFGPVWTILYALMAVAAWLVWRRRESVPTLVALVLFIFQLLLNASWSWVFFGMQLPGAALLVILVLWLAILATLVAFRHIHRRAAALLIPYLLWVSFAALLNFSFWRLNV